MIVSLQRFRWFALRSRQRFALQLDRQGADNARGDLILYREDVDELTVVALGPNMSAACRVDELSCYARPVTGAAHASFEHIFDAELAGNRRNIDRLTFVGEGRVASDHK